jgi:hypothetical protein
MSITGQEDRKEDGKGLGEKTKQTITRSQFENHHSTSPTNHAPAHVVAVSFKFAMEPDDLGPAVVIVAWVFAALAAVVVGTRLFVRLRIVPRTLRLDDYIILLTLVSLPFGTL